IGAEMLLKDSRQAEQVECPGKFSMNKVRIDVQRRFSLLVDRGHQQRIHPQNLLVRIKRRIVNGQPAIQISRIGVVKVDVKLELNAEGTIQEIERLKIRLLKIQIEMILLCYTCIPIVEVTVEVEFQIGIVHCRASSENAFLQRAIDRKILIYIVVEFKLIHPHFCIDVNVIHGHP